MNSEDIPYVQDVFAMLGKRARDKVTGYAGVAVSVSFDLYGCAQIALSPPAPEKADKNADTGHYFDVSRLEITDHTRVMPLPVWAGRATLQATQHVPGPAEIRPSLGRSFRDD